MKFHNFAALLTFFALTPVAFGEGVTWEQQAERLQMINSSFLDSVPFGEPIQASTTIDARAVVTFLPKVNPRVGGKSEDVPSAPAHLIPIFGYSQTVSKSDSFRIGAEGHFGYLPAGGEQLLGLTASLTQYLYGASGQIEIPKIANGQLYVPLGFQMAHAEVTGNITEKTSDDKFECDTTLITTGIGYSDAGGKFWKSLLLISKSTTSQFDIEVDDTSLKVEDTLSDASFPLALQLGGGVQVTESIRTGLAYLWVPERFSTGRILLNYGMTL